MSVSIEVACDRCRQPITTARVTLEFVLGGENWPTSPLTGKPAIDLCGPCCEAVFAAIRSNTPEAAPLDDATLNEVRQKFHEQHSRV